MITDDFSFEEGVVTRERMLSKPKHKEADDCVITFRPDLFWKIIKSYKSRKLGTVRRRITTKSGCTTKALFCTYPQSHLHWRVEPWKKFPTRQESAGYTCLAVVEYWVKT